LTYPPTLVTVKWCSLALADMGDTVQGLEVLIAGAISYVGALALGFSIWVGLSAISYLLGRPANAIWRWLDFLLVHGFAIIVGLHVKSGVLRWARLILAFGVLGAAAAMAPIWIAFSSILVASVLAFAVYRRWQAAEREYLDQVPDWQMKIQGERHLLLEALLSTALVFFFAPIGFARLAEVDSEAFRKVEGSAVVQEELGPFKEAVRSWDDMVRLMPGQGVSEVTVYTWAQALKGLPVIDYAEIYGVDLAPLIPNDDRARHATMLMRATLDLLLLASLAQILSIRANVRAGRDTRGIEAALRSMFLWRVEEAARQIELFGATGIVRPAEVAARTSAQKHGLSRIRDVRQRGLARFNLAGAIQSVGSQNGIMTLMKDAIASYRITLQELTRERMPLDWAMTQDSYGVALCDLGAFRDDERLIEEAISAHREALLERTRERAPIGWAITQNNLGNALGFLGGMRGDERLIEEAVSAFRESLKEWTSESAPSDWAGVQHNLGAALHRLGQMRGDVHLLENAVSAFRDVLKVWTRESAPLDWALGQYSLGSALSVLGNMRGDERLIAEGIGSYREALKEWTRERMPIRWAVTHNFLGLSLFDLGRMRSDERLIEEAVDMHREALKELTRERMPLEWALAQNFLGSALCDLGRRRSDQRLLEEAVSAYREALNEWTRERQPLGWASTQCNLGIALCILGGLRRDPAPVVEAIRCFEGALEVFTQMKRLKRVEAVSSLLAEARQLLIELQQEKGKGSERTDQPKTKHQVFRSKLDGEPSADLLRRSDWLLEAELIRAGGSGSRVGLEPGTGRHAGNHRRVR
jgi:tetratricopeptide (TPR) repeat protein